MTRCESPHGVEFTYDFPVASTSKATPKPARARSPRRHAPSPLPPRWASDSDEEDDESFEPHHRAHTLPVPTPTGNQWTTWSPSYTQTHFTPSHLSPYDQLYATPASYESERSVLSSFCSKRDRDNHTHNKIRKPRRSIDEPSHSSSLAPPPPLSYSNSSSSSAPSSPFSIASDDFSDMEAEGEEFYAEEELGLGLEEQDEGAGEPGQGQGPHALKKQWAALSLRVRFGVFRAKRKMRDRVLSL